MPAVSYRMESETVKDTMGRLFLEKVSRFVEATVVLLGFAIVMREERI